MGKAERNRRQSAREKIAAQQAAARRAERRKRVLLTGGSVAAVLAIVVAFVVVKTLSGPASAGSGKGTVPAGLFQEITGSPPGTLASVARAPPIPRPSSRSA